MSVIFELQGKVVYFLDQIVQLEVRQLEERKKTVPLLQNDLMTNIEFIETFNL